MHEKSDSTVENSDHLDLEILENSVIDESSEILPDDSDPEIPQNKLEMVSSETGNLDICNYESNDGDSSNNEHFSQSPRQVVVGHSGESLDLIIDCDNQDSNVNAEVDSINIYDEPEIINSDDL